MFAAGSTRFAKLSAMTWFADLSPCTYHGWPGDRLAVGWLDADHPFEHGSIAPALRSEIFLDRLFWAVVHRPVDKFRGYHMCEICPDEPFGPTWLEHNGERAATGSAQIDVSSADSHRRYVAPNLVFHYVTEHDYQPPGEFIEAVILGTINAEPRNTGQLVLDPGTQAEAEVRDPLVTELFYDELVQRFGAPRRSVESAITVEVKRVGRVLESIPEMLPSLSASIMVDGPIPRVGWTEWAPTKQATADAVDRMFENDDVLREAIEQALTT